MIEIELMGIAVLVANKEVAFLITQELRSLAIVQLQTEVFFQRGFLGQEAFVYSGKSLVRRMQAGGLTNCFVNDAFSALDVNRCLCRRRLGQLGLQRRALDHVQKIRKQEKIEMGCRI